MGKVTAQISMSLDGYVAGPNPSREEPLGQNGEELHEWVIATQSWRAQHGREGGEPSVDSNVMEAAAANVGAVIMGRGMFSGEGGPWGDEPWEGWWGDEPPFRCPVFVLTHHPREPLQKGATTFHFVTDGIESALEQAQAAAGDQDVTIGGGADAIQQFVRARKLDELHVHIVPWFLGGGTRLFDDLPAGPLERVEVVDSPRVTHIRYRLQTA